MRVNDVNSLSGAKSYFSKAVCPCTLVGRLPKVYVHWEKVLLIEGYLEITFDINIIIFTPEKSWSDNSNWGKTK